MIQFLHPWYIILLLLIPVMEWWYRYAGQKKEGTLRVSSANLLSSYFKKRGQNRNNFLRYLYYCFLVLIIIALAKPQWTRLSTETEVDVVDIVLVVDISSSMLAEDFPPNRLEVVKKTADQFIAKRKGDRIGLLVFAGETFIQCPLTVDISVLRNLLKEVTIVDRELDGTAIGMAIANATNRLRSSQATSKVMILLSDGSNNAGELDPLTAADMATEFNIRIYTIGAGTNESVTFIQNRGYIKNEIDETTLIAIAERTGGKYFRATDEKSLVEIYTEIDGLERTKINVKEFISYKELFGFILCCALIIAIGQLSLSKYAFRRKI